MASFSLPAAPFLEEEIPSAVEMIASMQGSRARGAVVETSRSKVSATSSAWAP
jgi:hypothetical protein